MEGWLTGALNSFLLLVQLRKMCKVGDSKAISLTMFTGFVFVNIGVSYSGFKDGNIGLGFGMAVSAAICIFIMILAVVLRQREGER